jgi:hypothetical protein
LIYALLCVSEINRIAGLCSKSKTFVSNSHEAINAVRNDRGAWRVPGESSPLRQSNSFNSDGFDEAEGGWEVLEWTKFGFIHGYSVNFEKFKPQIAIECELYACGAVDDCRTLGDY